MKQKTDCSLFCRRSRPLRIESDEYLWFVSSRTIEERFWLHPLLTSCFTPHNRQARRVCKALERKADKRLAQMVARANAMRGPLQPKLTLAAAKRIAKGLIGSAIARAQAKYDSKVFSLVVMSNHIQLVVQTRGKNLSRFMGYVKARISESINLLTGKRGPLWSRRYDAQAILDDEAAEDRVSYCLNNPVEASLVESEDSWPGLNLAYGMGESDEIEFEYLDRTAWHKGGRSAELGKYYRTAMLKLSPLPRLKAMQRKLVRESVKSWLGKRRGARGKEPRVLGIEGILNTAFESRPKHAEKSRRPYAFGSKEKRQSYYQSVSRLYDSYATASEKFRSGEYGVIFPEGMYRPTIAVAV